ncbi:MAG TPA: hypothetical protein VGR14_08255 [Verrucomicrobiae bacterium]|jgi:hypothetical protein|nr:hypothetical protein [Verrucomicrobiae bacterium]
MNKINDLTVAADAQALFRQWERLKEEQHLSGNQAAAALGKSAVWFCRKKKAGGDAAAFTPKPRAATAKRKLFTDLPKWFLPAARFFYLLTNRTSTRGSVPEALRRTVDLPRCPAAVQARLAKVLVSAGWSPINGEKLPACPEDLRESILARDRAGKLIVPESLMRDITVAAPFIRHSRNPKNAALDYITAWGTQMWMTGQDGERKFIRSGDMVECDDATINFPVCIPWEIRGDPCSERWGVKVGRFQWLVAIDVGSRKILGFSYTARPRSSYRSEDVLSLMKCVAVQHGVPRNWRLEKGIWHSNLVVNACKMMGSGRISVHSPHSKPFIEGLFNSLWTKLSCRFPQSSVGRFQGEGEEASRLLTACLNGSKNPARFFPKINDAIAAFREVIEEHNSHVIASENYGRWQPDDRWNRDIAERPLPKLAPENHWLFSPLAKVWMVRGSSVGGRVSLMESFAAPYIFSADWLLQFHGARVKCYFDPSDGKCEATIVLEQAVGSHRAGEILGTAPMVNETVSYMRGQMGFGHDDPRIGLDAVRQATMAMRRVVMGIAGPAGGDTFTPEYSEIENRNGLGGLSKIVRGTELPPSNPDAAPTPDQTPVVFTARNGKVARLPLAVRLQLNERLRDGHSGALLLEWLNGLFEVQCVLEREQASPITKQNLSEWRKGGFLEWLRCQPAEPQTPASGQAERGIEPLNIASLDCNLAVSRVA